MPKDTTAIETSNANKVFDLPVKLDPGHVNTMSFPQDSISEMHLTSGKELVISFQDGSKVQIENFQELVNSAQSCGKDTIIQLSDNTIIYPEELNAQLAQGPVSFGEKNAQGQDVLTLNEPPAGQIVEKNIEPGHEYKLGFNTDSTASAAQAGDNLILTFKDGGVLVLKNYYTAMNAELPPAMTLADGSVIDSNALLTSCKFIETPSFAQTVADEAAVQSAARKGSGEAAPNVEPAAGEESASAQSANASRMAAKKGGENAPDVEPAAGGDNVAQNAANVEPAAGTAGGLSGGRGGYGFASAPAGVALNGLSAIGAIGATQLEYTAPQARLGPTGPNNSAAAVTPDTNPFGAASVAALDESGAHKVSGAVVFNFGNDGPSQTVPPVQPTGDFAFTGSATGGKLTSHGETVTVTRVGDTYTGVAGGQTVFTFVVNADGSYTFTQSRALDHADGTDPNDIISLDFGVVGTDKDGDQAVTSVTINVLDDAPVANDDGAATGKAVSGNVLTNDVVGFDATGTVVSVTFNGQTVAVPATGNVTINGTYGSLVISANGSYTYTSSNTALGTDQFTYTMRDYDGDTDSANLSVTVNDLDTVPTIGSDVKTVDETDFGATISTTGKVPSNFFGDGPGTIAANNSFTSGGSKLGNALTSGGVAVQVTLSGNTYTGKAGNDTVFTLTVNADGSYTYTQFKTLDHADKSNPDDIINLNFGVIGTDADGDTASGSITINVKDDGPTAVADAVTVNATTQTVAGNVTTNDDFGSDGKPTHAVTKVIFNGTTYTLPTDGSNITITSANGKLVINDKGAYSYTATTTTGGVDKFTYVIADKDGDTDTAPATSTLTITTDDIDYIPTVTNDTKTIDETQLGPITVAGKVTADYSFDGPGSVSANGGFSSGGSKLGNALTSGGVAVNVTQVGNVYTGKAGNDTVFTLTIKADGTYSFVLNKPLDHADKTNPDDIINLNFGIIATDADGDKSQPGTITINVKDDGPTAVADTAQVGGPNQTITGNVTTNDNFGQDGKPTHAVTKVIFNGTTYTLPTDGSNVTITSANGKLVINDKGAYSYTATTTTGGTDKFTYVIADKDGDTDTAPATSTLTITTDDVDYTPTVTSDVKTIDETQLGPITVAGKVTADYSFDGPGSVSANGGFSSGGSKLGNALTSGGVAVAVTQSGNVYTGKAGNDTVFTLTIKADGTYSFVLNKPLDHADKTNPDDIINLNFGIIATDADGDKSQPGTITINVKDDGPTAVADTAQVGGPNQTITGNVTTNDNFGQDGKPTHAVTKVIFNGTTYTLPTDGSNVTITSANGKLVINDKGAYSYTATTTTGGTDKFTYVIADKDGDTDTAPATSTLTITTDDVDYTPTVTSDVKTIDETQLGPITVTGTITADFKGDGPGTLTGFTFNQSGSLLGGKLTSGGVAVDLAATGNKVVGTANGVKVFEITMGDDGKYSFTQFKPLDHANGSDPNDIITLKFGVVATDADGDKANGTITINIKDDAPIANDDTNSYDIITGVGQVINGNVVTGLNGGPGAADKLSVDAGNSVTKVSFNGVSYDVPATGTVSVQGAYGILKLAADGSYTYTITSIGNVAPGNMGVTITDAFEYILTDKDGDHDPAVLTLSGCGCNDDVPTIGNDTKTVDETDLGPISVSGKVVTDYKDDGAGPVTATGGFSSGGSKTNGALTSGGVAVTVTQVGNVYTGKAGTTTVFTLTINNDGSYTFVLNKPLDHADKTNPDDVINLNFGVITQDADGDKSNTGTITINVKDDGPLAVADSAKVSGVNQTITGNVTSNDDFGSDGKPTHAVTKVIFNGTTYTLPTDGSNVTITSANGKLVINDKGAYSYTATTTTGGTDKFTYVIADKDGDTDTVPATSTLTITTDDTNTIPTVTSDVKTIDETNLGPITVLSKVTGDYQLDGPGKVEGNGSFTSGGSKLGGGLTSDGVPVTVSQVGNVYTGKAGNVTVFTMTINADGSYSFVLNKPLDHADASNPNDSIALNFGVVAVDSDGDKSKAGNITINVLDDAPVANDDVNSYVGGAVNTVISGNVVTGLNGGANAADKLSKDTVNVVSKVSFNGVSYDVPTTGTVSVQGNHGVLKLAADGSYTYTITFVGTNPTITDSFTYILKDHDGDTDPAILTLSGADCIIDTTPTIGNDNKTVDETNLGPITVTGKVATDYKNDGAGPVTATGGFSSGGSKLGGNLTSGGVAVAVTQVGNVYTGKAGAVTVFTLTINADGTYSFVLNKPLDHADKTNPDDIINLNFGVITKDSDGDTSNTGTITINVKDDGPVAVADTANLPQGTTTVTGNVTSNDNFGQDGKPTHAVTKVVFNGTTHTLPTDGSSITITTGNGKLTINDKGAYSYTATTTTGGTDKFTYVISDKDGDTDTAPATSTLTITTDDIDYKPTITDDTKTVDESNMTTTTSTSVAGKVVADFLGDGPGTITGNNTFTATGSVAGNKLSYCGTPVTVTQVGNVYTGKAGTDTVFTLTINNDGSYNFVLNKPLDHADASNPNDSMTLNFGVVAKDADGDTATSTIKINVLDNGPTITSDAKIVDESNMHPTTGTSGKVTADFGADHDGTVTGNNSFSFSGSALNGKLTSNGVAVTVSQVGDTYVGKAGSEEVFRLTLKNDGTYDYLQSKVLDHADPKDPNDIIKLDFGVRATDCDGDKADGHIVISVLDDGPEVVPTPSVVVCANNYKDLYLPATGWAANVYMTADGIGQGQQVLTLKLTGIPQGWSFFSYQGGTYDAAAGTWTKTLAPGEDFDGKFYFKAPSEADVLNVNFTATVSEGGHSSTANDSFNIIVGAEDHAATMSSMMVMDDVSVVDSTHHTTSTSVSKIAAVDTHGSDMVAYGYNGVGDVVINLPKPVASNMPTPVGTEDAAAKSLSLTSVIEQDNSGTQSAIDSFVHKTSVESNVATTSPAAPAVAAADASATAHAEAVAATPAEQLHHLQSQVA